MGIPVWNKVSETKYLPQQLAEAHSYNSLDRKHTTHPDTPYSSSYESDASNSDSSRPQDLDAPYDSTKPRAL